MGIGCQVTLALMISLSWILGYAIVFMIHEGAAFKKLDGLILTYQIVLYAGQDPICASAARRERNG